VSIHVVFNVAYYSTRCHFRDEYETKEFLSQRENVTEVHD